MKAPIGSLRRSARILRQSLYPIPVMARRYLRSAGRRFCALMPRQCVCLDIGAGVAPYRSAVEKAFGTGLYVSLDFAASDQTTVIGDAMRLPIRDERVGIVLCLEVLQHISNTRQVLQEIRRVLAPGGLLIISFPFLYAECDVVDFFRWSIDGMEAEVRRCDLKVLDARRRGGWFFCAACVLQWAIQHIVPGARLSWRAQLTPLSVTRAAIVQLLTLPVVILGWIALGLDLLLPARGAYVGGFIIAQRPTDPAAT